MFKLLLLLGFFICQTKIYAQPSNYKCVYIVDSILVIDDPAEGDDISQNEIADVTVLKNKDTLKNLGFEKFDCAIYLFTKKYRLRPDSTKLIPSTKQMEIKENTWFLRGNPFNGEFIDYYYSGDKKEQGSFAKGKLNGAYKVYYKNGKLSVEREYRGGVADGMEKEYSEDGSLKQKGNFVDGKEEGIWEMYFPNGQVKQRSTFVHGVMNGEITIYYSTGQLYVVEFAENGKITPDERFEKVDKLIKKAKESDKNQDFDAAIRYCSKAVDLDTNYARTYFVRGTFKLGNLQYDEAVDDFDHALRIEPFMDVSLANRAFARIQKHEFGGGRKLVENKYVTVLAGKNNVPFSEEEKDKICSDLREAVFLGNDSKKIKDALLKYCK